MFKKPMRASLLKGEAKFPLYASVKLDGFRAVVVDGVVLSKKLIKIPNKHVQKLFGKPEYDGFDGEIVVGDPTANNCIQKTSKGLLSEEGEPDATFYVFDLFNSPYGYEDRYASLRVTFRDPFYATPSCKLLEQTLIKDANHLLQYEDLALLKGYEGVMVRSVDGIYKQGTVTESEGYLLKIKRFEDSEAICVGVVERMKNNNPASKDNTGNTKRSSAKAGKAPAGEVGAIQCVNKDGLMFEVGPGKMTKEQRKYYWDNQKTELIGKWVKYKHFSQTGVKDKPRLGTWLCMRDPMDMEEV
jgi:DNA ligase-1